MVTLFRPKSGRAIAGVALGIAEFYGIPVIVVRVLFVAAFLSTPLALLAYLLLTVSMHGEEVIVSGMSLARSSEMLPVHERFETLIALLSHRVLTEDSLRRLWQRGLGILLILFGVALEIPRMQGIRFSYSHPFAVSFFDLVPRFGTSVLYLTAGIAVLIMKRQTSPPVEFSMARTSQFALDQSQARLIGGLAAGLSRMVEVDVAYIRVLLILLNIFTFGIVGFTYLLVLVVMRRTARSKTTIEYGANAEPLPIHAPVSGNGRSRVRLLIGMLFLILSAMSIASELGVFYFNESVIKGLVLASIGFVIVLRGIPARSNDTSALVLSGAAIVLLGVGDLCSKIFHVQLSSVERFEVLCLIAFLTVVYYSVVMLQSIPRRSGFLLGATSLGSAVLIVAGVVPSHYLTALTQFYDFFYPVIFLGFGLWLAMEA